jgi:hypothetical protein
MRSQGSAIRFSKSTGFSHKHQRYRANWLTPKEAALLLFQPDVLVASEFFEGARKERHADPTRKLMLAMLEDAVNCLQHYALDPSERGKTLFHNSKTWIMDRRNHWIFSFENVCELLELNPDYIRDGLRRWEERLRAVRE